MVVFGNENEKEGAKARLRLALHEHFSLIKWCGMVFVNDRGNER